MSPAMATEVDHVGAFLTTPLVQWVQLILSRESLEIDDLVDGNVLSSIMISIDPRPNSATTEPNPKKDVNIRVRNLSVVLRHIKAYFEEMQQQVIVMSLPHLLTIARDYRTEAGIIELQKLLLLMLGCAVQCDQRELFIEKMKQLTYEGMEVMMNHIKDMTENTDKVLNMQWLDQEAIIPPDELEELTRSMSFHIRKLAQERDNYSLMITELTQERDYLQEQGGSSNNALSRKESFVSPATKQHLMVENSDLKAQLRKSKQLIDDNAELMNDMKSDIEEKEALIRKLRGENVEMTNDARSARAYRDENDILREKAGKAVKLESEVERLNEKLKDVEFYKQRCEELREDNKVLHETQSILEDQVEETQHRLDDLIDSEKNMIKLRQQLQELSEERDNDRSQIQELIEEKMNLELEKKQSMNESGNLAYQLEQARTGGDGGRRSILAESEESASTKILRLEKENRRLQSVVNSYNSSMTSSQISDAKMIELEKENKRLSSKVTQLQEKLQKEKQSVLEIEHSTDNLETQKTRLESTLETVRANNTRMVDELKQENEQLNKTIESLRHRAKISAEGKARELEKENKVLSETVQEVSAKMHEAEFERKSLKKSLERAKESIERSEVVQKENAKLEKDNISLQKKIAQLKVTCEKLDRLEQMNSDLDVENRQLQRKIENLRNDSSQAQNVETEKANIEQENMKLKRKVESLRKSCEKLSEVEQQKMEAEKAVARMQRTMNNMQKTKKQSEKMEVLQTELENELERVRGQLDVSTVSKDNEINELEKENEELQSKLDKLVTSIKRLDQTEGKNKVLETENSQLTSYKKKASKENERIKHTLEAKNSKIDDLSEELASMTRQNRALMQQNEKSSENSGKVRQLETQLREAQKQQCVEKKNVTMLREELVNEKLMVQQKQSELDKLSTELESIGLNKQQLLNTTQGDQSDKRFKALQSRFESTFQKSMETKEEKILSLEARLKESSNLNMKLREDIKNLKRDYEALAQRHQEEVDFSKTRKSSFYGKNSATDELLKFKDHLISVERKNATMIAENSSLRTSNQDYKERLDSLNSQARNLQSQQGKLQESNSTLQTQCAKLQVENSLLQSQTASMVAQNANVTLQQNSLEGEKHDLSIKLEEAKTERQNLLKDHDDLMQLHENQTMEVENLMQDHQKLKTSHRQIKTEYKELENKYNLMLKTRDEVERLRKMLQEEHRKMEDGTGGTNKDASFDTIKKTHDKLNRSYKRLSDDYEQLQNVHKTLKTNHNTLKLEYAKLEAETDDVKDRNHQLNLVTTKLNNRCDVLLQLKENLEDENRHLLEQINRLMSQNEELLSQTLESKDQIYTEQKQYTERMQEIRRQKEKLEEKIMDLYRTPQSPPKKNKGFGATIKKTFGLGKSSENRRRRDGLPPSSGPTPTSTKFKSSPPLLQLNDDSVDGYASPSAERDNESLGSHDSTDKNRRGSGQSTNNRRMKRNLSMFNTLRRLYPVQRKGSYSLKDASEASKTPQNETIKRRTRLGGGMAYSTTAINVLSTGLGDPKGSDDNLKGRYQSIEDIHARVATNSQSSLDRDSAESVESAEVSSQQIRATSFNLKTVRDSASAKSQGRSPSVSSEEKQLSHKTPTKEKISLQQFLDETKNSKTPALSRSPSPGSEIITLEQFLQENLKSSSKESSKTPTPQVSLETHKVTPRQRPNGVQARPMSMIEKPTGSVSPYSHLTSHGSTRQVQSNISPRLTPSHSILSQTPRSGSAIERLDSLLGGSPRDTSRQSNSRQTSTTPTPTSRKPQQSNYGSLPRAAQRNRIGSAHAFSPQGLTSTPVSTKQVDIALVNPMVTSKYTPTRRDVPPDSEPSPIPRDSNSSSTNYHQRDPDPRQSNISAPRRPQTPTKPRQEEPSNDSDKSTLWFEYGCV